MSGALSAISSLTDGGLLSSLLGTNLKDILQASTWRGIGFVVNDCSMDVQPSIVVHEYPYSDWVQTEDMGRGKMILSFSGYLKGDPASFSGLLSSITSFGATSPGGGIDAVYKKEQPFIDAVNKIRGPGKLVHPTLGSVAATCLHAALSHTKTTIGTIGISLEFVLVDPNANKNLFGTSTNTQLTLFGHSISSLVSCAKNFIGGVTGLVSMGLNLVAGVVATVGGVVRLAESIPADAAAVFNCVEGLGFALGSTVTLGRYANGNLTQAPPILAQLPVGLTTQATLDQGTALLIAAGVTNQAIVAASGASLETMAANFTGAGAANFANAVQALVATVSTAVNDPGDQLRLLSAMASYQPPTPLAGASQTASLIRRTALCALAGAVSTYTPSSSNDAQARLAEITPLYDAEIEAAADLHDVESYSALRDLRQTIWDDLTNRAAFLPELVTLNVPAMMPACVLSQLVFQDGSRENEIILRNNPVHPLFCNSTISVLTF